MSIIHEALKKTQESRKQAAQEAAAAKENSTEPSPINTPSNEIQREFIASPQSSQKDFVSLASQGLGEKQRDFTARDTSSQTAHCEFDPTERDDKPAPHVPRDPAPQSAKESRYRAHASIQAISASPIFWRALGVSSLAGFLMVATIGAYSIYHMHMNLKSLPFFSHLSGKTQVAQAKPIVAAPANLVLNGIMMEGKHRVAVINDQTYQVGDSIEDKKITAISLHQVTLQNNQTIFELRTKV